MNRTDREPVPVDVAEEVLVRCASECQRVDELRPTGHESLPFFSTTPILVPTESEDSQARCHRSIRYLFFLNSGTFITAYACGLYRSTLCIVLSQCTRVFLAWARHTCLTLFLRGHDPSTHVRWARSLDICWMTSLDCVIVIVVHL